MKKTALLSFLLLVVSFVSHAISPITGSTTTCVGWLATLTDATPGGTWSSSNPAVATVDATSGSVTGVSVGIATITYRVGIAFVVTGFTVNPADVITGGGSTLCAGTTMTLSGSPAGGSWTSGTPTVATVSSTGFVTGVGTGVVNIYYTGGGCYVYRIVTVNAALSPITGVTTLGTGGSTTLSNSTPGGSWSSSNTAIATVGSTGIVFGMAAGTCNITYTTGACYVYAPVTVTASITPIAGVASACAGSTSLLSCSPLGGVWSSSNTAIAVVSSTGLVTGLTSGVVTIRYTVGPVFATRSFTVNPVAVVSGATSLCTGTTTSFTTSITGGLWSSSNTAIATVSSAGLVTAMGSGVVTISYNLGGCYTYRTLTVNAMPVISGSSSACVGTATTLTATPLGGLWSSSNTAVAVVSSAGIVTGVAAGTVNITYTSAGCTAIKPMTLNVTPTVSGGTSLCVGTAMPLSGLPSGGFWSSSDMAVATVSTSGLVSGVGAGVATISYTIGSCTTFSTVTVNSMAVISGSSNACVGAATALTATPLGGLWSSSSPAVAVVSTAGLVTGVAVGTTNITYTSSGCTAVKTMTVNVIPSVSGVTSVCVGAAIPLTGLPAGGVWSTSSSLIAIVGSTGIVTGAGGGIAGITYSRFGCASTYTVSVNAIPVISGPGSVCTGSSVSYLRLHPEGPGQADHLQLLWLVPQAF